MKFNWRHQYDDVRDKAERLKTDCEHTEPSLAQQQYKDEVDLNVMVKRMGVTKDEIPVAAPDPRYYGDFSGAVDFREALDRVREAEQRFNELPAAMRREFNNDPGELLRFVADPKNLDEAVKKGLLTRRPEPAKPAETTPVGVPPTP